MNEAATIVDSATAPAAIVAALEENRRERQGILAAADRVALMEELRRRFPIITDVFILRGGHSATVTADVRIDTMHQLAEVLRALARAGWHWNGRGAEDVENVRLNYHLRKRGDKWDGPMLYLCVTFTGAGCTFQKIGEKTVPVMKIRCAKVSA